MTTTKKKKAPATKKPAKAAAWSTRSLSVPAVVDEAKARDVIGEGAPVKGKARGSLKRRADSEGLERLGVYLPPELLRDVRLRCVHEGRNLSIAVEEALRGWLART